MPIDTQLRVTQLRETFSGLPSRLVVISGPSAGAGKGKVITELLALSGDSIWQSVSVTTRQLRPDDKLHHHYDFLSLEEFQEMERRGGLLEANGVTEGNRYGTPLQPIVGNLRNGKIALLEIEVNGANFVHHVIPEGLFIFIKPTDGDLAADVAELRRRLEGRGTNDAASIERRLSQAEREIMSAKELGFYDAFVVNARGESDKAAHQIYDLIKQRWPSE